MSVDQSKLPLREKLAIELAEWRGHGQREKTYDEADRIMLIVDGYAQRAPEACGCNTEGCTCPYWHSSICNKCGHELGFNRTEQPKAEIDGDQMLELRDRAFNLLPAWPKSTVDERLTISGRIVHKVVAELKRRGFLERPEQASGVLPIEVFAVMDLALHNELHLRDRGHKECDALCIKCAAEKAAAVLGFES